MNDFEKLTILVAFSRCYGLQDAFKGRNTNHLDKTGPIMIQALAEQTGFQFSFIKEHLKEISEL